jgi:hypothetical protein
MVIIVFADFEVHGILLNQVGPFYKIKAEFSTNGCRPYLNRNLKNYSHMNTFDVSHHSYQQNLRQVLFVANTVHRFYL